jgi:integrase
MGEGGEMETAGEEPPRVTLRRARLGPVTGPEEESIVTGYGHSMQSENSREEVALEAAMAEFIEGMRLKHRQELSIANVETTFREMLAHAQANGWPERVGGIGRRHVAGFLLELESRPRWHGRRQPVHGEVAISRGYYETLFRRLRTFFSWCLERGYLWEHPMEGMEAPKPDRPVVPVFTGEELQLLRDATDPALAPPGIQRFLAQRNLAALAVLAGAPASKSEVTGLRVGDLDLEAGQVMFGSRDGRRWSMPIGRATGAILEGYLGARKALDPDGDDLWVNARGLPMQPDWLPHMLGRLARRAGVKDVRVSRFRRTFEHRMRALEDDEVREAHRRVSPADRLWRIERGVTAGGMAVAGTRRRFVARGFGSREPSPPPHGTTPLVGRGGHHSERPGMDAPGFHAVVGDPDGAQG